MNIRDQFLTEKVLGECWHDYDRELVSWGYATSSASFKDVCKKCKSEKRNNNFSTYKGFFKLWNFCKKQGWWTSFLTPYTMDRFSYARGIAEIYEIIDPDIFADAIAKYMGWEGE